MNDDTQSAVWDGIYGIFNNCHKVHFLRYIRMTMYIVQVRLEFAGKQGRLDAKVRTALLSATCMARSNAMRGFHGCCVIYTHMMSCVTYIDRSEVSDQSRMT
jgi:hypothetical protein